MIAEITVSAEALGAACGAITLLGGLATAYLRLAMGKALHDMRDAITEQMRQNFVFKEAHRPEMHEIKREIARHEAKLDRVVERLDILEIDAARHGEK